MYSVVKTSVVALVLSVLHSGCGTGYQKVDGEWSYVTWDEGNGRKVHELDADDDTFTVLRSSKEYAKDKNKVFYRREPIDGADPETFHLLDVKHYAADKSHVFLFKHMIRGADPASFKIIKPPYSRDANHVYCGTIPMNVADIDRFEPVQCSSMWRTVTAAQGGFLFDYGESFADLDISKERPALCGEGWSRDGKFYYYGPGRVEGADYASFRIIDSSKSADKNRNYECVFPADEFEERRKRFLEK